MNRRTGDLLVGAIAVVLAFVGGILTGQAYERRQSVDSTMGSMMDGSTGTMHGTDPIAYVVGTLVAVGLVVGVYLAVRESRTTAAPPPEGGRSTRRVARPTDSDEAAGPGGKVGTEGASSTERTIGTDEAGPTDSAADRGPSSGSAVETTDRVLDVLPEDERRILEPVLESPGITQIALRDRSEFSKSKVSQTVTDLEKRGLLYREKQGRTFRIYPADDLGNDTERVPDA
ncbi:MAG: putative membrane protein [Halobacteriales archaeon]|jgi:uncharacterized membrane protein